MNDYAKFAEDAPNLEGLADLSRTALDLYEAELEVARCEEELRAAKKRVEDISVHTLPDLMDDLGLAEMKLQNGTKLEVKQVLTLGSGVGKNPAVLEWLEKTNNSGLIKRSINVHLGKDADEKEAALVEELRAEGFSDFSSVHEVHAQTLTAHVRKLLKAGADVDMDLLGAREFKRAKITGKPKDGSSAFGE